MTRLALIAAGSVMVMALACRQSPADRPDDHLKDGWTAYKGLYIQAPGNVVDPSRGGGDTTSEGQGYAMLRAAWMRDEETFVRAFEWTEQHLKRSDGLYSWLWTPQDGGHVVDVNTASDADQEIALALILGSRIFNRPALMDRGRQILLAIRTHERLEIGAGWFPAAGNWSVFRRIVNLSYFLPYAYPYFARVDPDGRWESVTETGYDLIARSLARPSARLVPDFMAVTAEGDVTALPPGTGLSGDFSSDAMRIYWRVALDCQLHRRARACADLLSADQLASMMGRDGALFTRYTIEGMPLERVESSSFYGAVLPFLMQHKPAVADAIRSAHLSPPMIEALLLRPNHYFDANWVWFGLAAADGRITASTPALDLF